MKKSLIIVPHQDDEINLTGGIIRNLINKQEIFVLYTTNGDYSFNAKYRIKECFKALKILGIKKENVYFLGYSDQYSEGQTHLYNVNEPNTWTSRNGIKKTYAPNQEKEVAILLNKEHHNFNKNNFINDIKKFIKLIKPDYIYAVDFDSHADHRATSLATERAIGEIIKEEKDYYPIVYKGFAYPTAYLGVKDFKNINIQSTKFNTEKYSYSQFENPYYLFDNRIRFPLKKECINKLLFLNVIFKALKCHKTQTIIRKSYSIINGDQIFWQRRTDNLLYNAIVEVSSGDKNKLTDFLLFECPNVLKGKTEKPKIISEAWIPNITDKKPKINILFKAKKEINQIKIYQQCEYSDYIKKIRITIEGNYKDFNLIKEQNNINIIKLKNVKTNNIQIEILERTGTKAGISELELFATDNNRIEFIKLEIDNSFAYKYYLNNESEYRIYSYDGHYSKYLNNSEINFITSNVKINNNRISLLKSKGKIRIELKDNPSIFDEVILIKKTKAREKIDLIINIINDIYLKINIIISKTTKKVIRVLNKLKKTSKY